MNSKYNYIVKSVHYTTMYKKTNYLYHYHKLSSFQNTLLSQIMLLASIYCYLKFYISSTQSKTQTFSIKT